uniref:Uncharacterized protein n=2 Tax=Oryza sativa subsp. japonica TaxID=39947 RepID=Q94LN4_ORYSJ|nr:Hypothetical protein [Oryza sativa Japonica Group]AAP51863.1 hypothetical protein LOC_Os10g02530 [Oryza sativa Japonica Group]
MAVIELPLAIVAAWAQIDCTVEQIEAELTPLADIGLAGKGVDIDNLNCPPGNFGSLAEYFAPSAQGQSESAVLMAFAESVVQSAALVAFAELAAQPVAELVVQPIGLGVFVESAAAGLGQQQIEVVEIWQQPDLALADSQLAHYAAAALSSTAEEKAC